MKSRKKNNFISLFIALIFLGSNHLLQAQNYVPFNLNGLWGLKNKQGLVIVEPKYIAIGTFSEGMTGVAVKVGEKYIQGFIDENGTEVIPIKYAGTWQFSEGLAAFAIESGGYKWGYLDKTGKIIIEPKYEATKSFKEGKALVTLNGKSFYIDKTGKETPSAVATATEPVKAKTETKPTVAALTPFEENNKWGFKDQNGKVVVTAKYDEFMNFSGYFSTGFQTARIGQKWTYIDRTGKELIPFKYNLINDFSEGLASVNIGACCHDVEYTVPMGGKWGYINKSGIVIIPIVYDYAVDFKEGVSYVMKYNIKDDKYSGSKWALINKAGKELTTFKYDGISEIKGGVICASVDHKFGFLDKTGKEVIALIYDNAYDFSEGLAAVKNGDKWGFIDITGKIIIPIEYENKNNLYGFVEGCSPAKKNGKIGFIDKTGKEITPFEYDDLKDFNQERAGVKKGDKWGFIGRKGNIIIEIKYDKVENIGNNGLKITSGFRDGNEYSLDSTGKETFVKEIVKPKAILPATAKTNTPKTETKPVAVSIDQLLTAIEKGDLVLAESLINKGVNVKAIGGGSGRTALHYICDKIGGKWADINEVKENVRIAELLIKKGANVNAVDDNGETALHFAANGGNLEMVKLLLKNGADTKIKTKYYNVTALDRAKNNKHKEIVEELKNYK